MSNKKMENHMLIVIGVAAAAALAVVAYGQLQHKSEQGAAASLRMVRDLAAVVLVCTKAVEGVVDVLTHHRIQAAPATSSWGYRSSCEYEEDEQR